MSNFNFELSQQDINKLVNALKEPLINALLDNLLPVLPQSQTQNENDMLTAVEVQELLGIRPSTFYKWHAEGKIKGGVKSGKYWRFKRSEIEKLIHGG